MADTSEAQPSTSSSHDKPEDKKAIEDAVSLLAQGKRNMLCGEVTKAVQQLQDATKIFADQYGEVADQCGEAYLAYGTALLDLSRMESGVLGNALTGIENESSEEGSAESDDKVEDPEKVSASHQKASKKSDEEGDGEAANGAEEAEDGEDEGESEAVETEEEEGEKKSDTSQEEDVSNLQVAWEVLELAKVIYSRHESKEMQLKAADAFLKLGEVGMETENYPQAIGDLKSCLKIQQEHLEIENRCIAETHYQLGLANTLARAYPEALEHYRLAIKTIESKIAKLKCEIEESEKSGKHKEAGSFDEKVIIAEKEMKDLSEILPDIRAKMEDTEDEMKNADTVAEMQESDAQGLGESSTAAAATAEPAKDISHMIRKKRKPDEEANGDGDSAKKPRQEESAKDTEKKEEDKTAEKPDDDKAGGDAPKTNGTAEPVNGTNGTSSPEKKDVTPKTVEDVKAAAEEATA